MRGVSKEPLRGRPCRLRGLRAGCDPKTFRVRPLPHKQGECDYTKGEHGQGGRDTLDVLRKSQVPPYVRDGSQAQIP